jgi:two-component system, NarL family, nitrate/nitrite response regulator NarL
MLRESQTSVELVGRSGVTSSRIEDLAYDAHRALRIVIADEQQIVLSGLRVLLASQPNLEVVGTATDGATAIESIRALNPDIAILDIHMPRISGIDVLRQISIEGLRTKIVFLTGSLSEVQLQVAVRAGVWGIVLKSNTVQALLDCIDQVAHRKHYVLPEISRPNGETDDYRREAAGWGQSLTTRELEIAGLVILGLSNKEIARHLSITPGTVKLHLAKMYQKVGVNNRTALAYLRRSDDLFDVAARACEKGH